jgi:hypothetical protein
MMNRGVMDRQMFRNGGAAFPDLSGDGRVTQRDILMGRGVIPMQQGGNPALQASIAAFMEQYGRAPTQREIAQIADAQRMMMQEGATGPSTMSPDGPGPEGYDLLTPQMLGPMSGETVYGPRPTVQEEGAGMLGGFAPGPSQELPPSINLEDYFQSQPVIRRQEGGPAMVMPSDMASMAQQMPAAAAAMSPPEQEVVMGAMQASGGPEVQQMIASEAQSYGDPETAQSYEEMMNMVRGDQATVEERRSELAMLVGDEDAMQTPESVLALVQPIVQLSMVEEAMAPGDNVDAGVGALAAQQMTTPIQGDMAGGVMTLAGGPEPQMQGMA